jgi:hypothetical protein
LLPEIAGLERRTLVASLIEDNKFLANAMNIMAGN